MNDVNDLEEIEEELKQEAEEKNVHKVSGRSIFDLERVIKEKSEIEKNRDGQKDS